MGLVARKPDFLAYEQQSYRPDCTDSLTRKYNMLRANFKLANALDFQQCCMCGQQSLRSACACAQSDQSLC